jgi:hypothetical protein
VNDKFNVKIQRRHINNKFVREILFQTLTITHLQLSAVCNLSDLSGMTVQRPGCKVPNAPEYDVTLTFLSCLEMCLEGAAR